MKKIIFLIMFSLFMLPMINLNASTTKMGRFWEYFCDPADPAHSAERNSTATWMKNNFDEHNIPLMSVSKIAPDGSYISGVDSIFKHNPVTSRFRFYAYVNRYDIPLSIYYPYYAIDQSTGKSILSNSGSGSAAFFAAAKAAVDQTENNSIVSALTPITITSQYNNSTVTGTFQSTFVDEYPFSSGSVLYQIILAEGFHKYGNDEFYFIPRATKYINAQSFGNLVDGHPGLKINEKFTFKIDKSWNPNYLYVIGFVELNTYEPRILFDVAVDRVVDVKNANTALPIKLDIVPNSESDKCKKVQAQQTATITYKITNPTNKLVKANVFIDSNTSTLSGWNISLNKTSVVITSGSNTTVTLTAKAPSNNSVAAIDLAVLPFDVEENENPVYSNSLALIATETVRMLCFVDAEVDRTSFATGFSNNPYYENIVMVSPKYHSATNPELFDAFIFSCVNNRVLQGQATAGEGKIFLIFDRIGKEFSDEQMTTMSNHLTSSELTFINSAIEKGKHFALFIDKSGAYSKSSGATAAEKQQYNTLFDNFNVSYNSDAIKIDIASGSTTNGQYPINSYQIKGVSTDSIGKVNGTGSPIELLLNQTANNISTASSFISFFTPKNNGKQVFYYDNNTTSSAMVKSTKGTSKLLIAGFGFLGTSISLNTVEVGNILNNITTWWFGYKVLQHPMISIPDIYYEMGEFKIDDTLGYEKKILVTNTANASEGPLKIYNVTFLNDVDGSFTITQDIASHEILAGQTDTLKVRFIPNNVTLYSNITLEIQSNAYQTPILNLYFSGRGLEGEAANVPEIYVEQTELFINFTPDAPIEQGKSTSPKPLHIYNAGKAPLIISSITLTTDPSTSNFYLQGIDQINILQPKKEAEYFLYFSPIDIGSFSGQITINTNDPVTPVLIIDFIGEVIEPIGINDEQIAKMFNCSVSPNPSSDFVNVKFNVIGDIQRNVKISIRDNSGRLVKLLTDDTYLPGEYSNTIDVHQMQSGTYFLEYVIDDISSSIPLNIAR